VALRLVRSPAPGLPCRLRCLALAHRAARPCPLARGPATHSALIKLAAPAAALASALVGTTTTTTTQRPQRRAGFEELLLWECEKSSRYLTRHLSHDRKLLMSPD
jgi:hypothetical protein